MSEAEPMAKSEPPMTLRQHTDEVEHAVAELVAALQTPLDAVVLPTFASTLRTAAFFHDLGKAASGFQDIVTYRGDKEKRPRWGYRHEALSTAVLLASGLISVCDPQLAGAVLTHHKTLDHEDLTKITGRGQSRSGFDRVGLRFWKEKLTELRPWWEWLRQYVSEAEQCGRIPALPRQLPLDPVDLPDLYDVNDELEEALRERRGLHDGSLSWILARGLLMAGDHLASAGLGQPLTALSADAIQPRPQGFQKEVQATQGSAMLEAPTGSGKTEAALHWALANRSGGERIFYILPYQASINKMNERLGNMFGSDSVGIIHHRAILQEFSRHFDAETDNYGDASRLAKQRMDQTRQFYRPVKIMTPYQLLKLMFGCRFFEIGLSELLGGLVIFDEIHAYDPHVVALIEICVSRLNALQVRFLFMTATFPDFLKDRLRKLLPDAPLLTVGNEDERDRRLMGTARHVLKMHDATLDELTLAILSDAKCGKKVLVVCNRVAQAQEMFASLQGQLPSVALLHSRFISRDRARKENELVAFPESNDAVERQIPKSGVLISTQVVEVSLNLSFDTIYTEIAPVDALLQRFGRVNRSNQHNAPVPVHVARHYNEDAVKFIYSPERIKSTNTHAPNGQDLFPGIENEWVRGTYEEGYTEDEQKKYDDAYAAFTTTVNNLKPFYSGNDEDFYELFDNYNVVPIRFAHLYRKAILDKRYYEAANFVASLSQSTFYRMKKDAGEVEHDTENHIYILNRRYDENLGLLNEAEVDGSFTKEAFEMQCY